MKNNRILHIRQQHAAFIGDFGFAAQHHHAAPVLLVGLSGPIRVQIGSTDAVQCRSALIDANVEHSVDCQGEHAATLYCEVDSLHAANLRNTFLNTEPFAFDITQTNFQTKRFEKRILAADLPALLKYTISEHQTPIDPRIAACLDYIKTNPQYFANQSNLAEQVSLSRSRLNHLFKGHTGVSFRRFKLWSQLTHFMRDIHATNNITHSALNSGFSDSSHLSNSYRKIFGLTPSSILTNLDEFAVTPFK